MFRDYFCFSLNGRIHRLRGALAFKPLSDILRQELGLTGTKVVCAEGDCGACTVMHQRAFPGEIAGFSSLNSCISSGLLLDGCHVVTVEGLGGPDQPSEIQESFVRNFGAQCGFCTPGFVMSVANLYENKSEPSERQAKNQLTGNLCRCTGYDSIIKSALDVNIKNHKRVEELFDFKALTSEMKQDASTPILVQAEGREFFAPTHLEMASEYKSKHPGLKIFSGATDLGVQINKGFHHGPHLMSLHLIPELYQISHDEDSLQVGARVTLHRFQKYLEPLIPEVAEFLNIFASPQIKNTGTLVGNLANASPIADTTPFLMALDATVNLLGSRGPRRLSIHDLFRGYKTLNIGPEEFIASVEMQRPNPDTKMRLYKISQRRDLDISSINSCFSLELIGGRIKNPRVIFGGVGPTPLRVKTVEAALEGQLLSRELFTRAGALIAQEISPLSDLRGSREFRQAMASELFFRFAEELL